ncbi:MAG: LCP family protein [Lachnospiraceae bacterium]
MQAVAYARIRKVGNADYQRTERQREVLMKAAGQGEDHEP